MIGRPIPDGNRTCDVCGRETGWRTRCAPCAVRRDRTESGEENGRGTNLFPLVTHGFWGSFPRIPCRSEDHGSPDR